MRCNALSVLGLGGVLFGCLSTVHAAQQDRIQGLTEGNQTVILHGHVRPEVRGANDLGSVDSGFIVHGLELVLGQTAEQTADLEQFLEAQRDPSSPDYQRWLSPEEFGDRFGLSENDLGRLASWLEAQGFVVEQTARARNWISFSGAAGDVEAAFATKIHLYETGGMKHFANLTDPSIPASLAGIVSAIRGMDDFRPQPPNLKPGSRPDFNATNGNHFLAPDDFATIYDIQSLYNAGYDGTGQRLVIAGQTDINLADIRAFRSQFHLPAKDPQLVLSGADPGVSTADQIEADLDLEWSGAVARNGAIVYVYSRNVFDAVQYAVDQALAPVISVSYGGCETWVPPAYRSIAQQANAEGITWINASGDSGAAGCDNGAAIATSGPSPTFPADLPEVTGVGGTEFSEAGGSYWSAKNGTNLGSALSYIPEKAWNDSSSSNGLAAGGGGASTIYAKPWWQTGPGVPNDQARDVPDVALSASGTHDAYIIYANGGLISIGGTSAPAPSFAGIAAILNQYVVATGVAAKPGLGNMNPSLYSLAQGTAGAFHDITMGDISVPCATGTTGCASGSFGYKAGPGYDLATGLGSLDAWNLVTKWATLGPAVGTTTVLSANPGAIAQIGSTQLTASVSAVTGSRTPTGSVTFLAGTTRLGSAVISGSGTTASAVLSVNGTTLAAGANTITASYTGAAAFMSSTATAVVNVTAAAIATSVTLTANPVSIAQSGSTVLTAVVRATSGSTVPVGTVTFSAGNTKLGTEPLTISPTAAVATLTVKAASLAVGANALTASYSGGSGFASGASAPLTVTLAAPTVSTTTTLTANPPAILQSASTVLTAIVKASTGTAVPAGVCTFTLGNTTLGTANLAVSSGLATATLTVKGTSLSAGANTISAGYSGNSGFAASTGTFLVTVAVPPTLTSTSLVAVPASISPLGSTVVTATVSPLSGTAAPNGSVTFAIPGAAPASTQLTAAGGRATASITIKGSSLAAGPNIIAALYIASGTFAGSASSVLVTVVSPTVPTTLTLTATPGTIGQKGSTQLTATVRAASVSNTAGSVTFATGKTTLGTAILTGSGGTATASLTVKGTSLALGNNTINAVYAGSGFSSSSGSTTVNVTPQASAKEGTATRGLSRDAPRHQAGQARRDRPA